jgi:hypothetical protein
MWRRSEAKVARYTADPITRKSGDNSLGARRGKLASQYCASSVGNGSTESRSYTRNEVGDEVVPAATSTT